MQSVPSANPLWACCDGRVASCCCFLSRKDELSALTQDVSAFHTSDHEVRDWYGSPDAPRRRLLDKPSKPHPILSLLMDEALRRIMLTSDGAIMALRERVTGSYADTRTPTSDLAAMIDSLGERFCKCKTHRARFLVIKEAQAIAARLRYAPDRSVVRNTSEWREKVAQDPRPCRIAAEVYGVSFGTVRRIKKAAGTLAKHGGPRSTVAT